MNTSQKAKLTALVWHTERFSILPIFRSPRYGWQKSNWKKLCFSHKRNKLECFIKVKITSSDKRVEKVNTNY